MNLDQLTLEIRPRSAWEALDLGLLMARRWWWPLTKAWLMVTAPLLALALLVTSEYWWISLLLLWWLKPLCERPLLYILSHAVFNDLPSTRRTLGACIPALALRQGVASLSWRRFSPTRSMDLPVLQLEGLGGARRQERLGLLHREDAAPAGWLTLVGLFLELCLWLGLMSLIWLLIPRELDIEWAGLFVSDESSHWVKAHVFLGYIAMALTAPFYVAGGFALYLNRRVKLEAWDIDIAFRRLVNKRKTSELPTLLFAGLVASVLFLTNASQPVQAAETPAAMPAEPATAEPLLGEYQELDRNAAQEAIKDVLQQREFSQKETRRSLKWDEPEEDEPSEFWEELADALRDFEGFVAAASLLEILLWLAVIALIALLLFRYRTWLAAQFVRVAPAREQAAAPSTLFGMAVTRESLPDNISQSATQLLQAGDSRAALALLYRASLSVLIQQGVDIHEGHTEGECLTLAQLHFAQRATSNARAGAGASETDPTTYFAQLTRVWQQLAYGHRLPDDQFARQLCATWNHCWQPLSGGAQ